MENKIKAKTYGVQVMMNEHDSILEFLKVVRKACVGVMNGNEPDEADFYGFIDFARNYSDKHHHGKEEKFLFNQMVKYLGEAGKTLVQNGMLVEHDLCRSHILDLEMALKAYKENPCDEFRMDIIEAAAGYANLLSRHIEKENSIVYTFAERVLKEDVLNVVDSQVRGFEENIDNSMKSAELLEKLKLWKEKYLR